MRALKENWILETHISILDAVRMVFLDPRFLQEKLLCSVQLLLSPEALT